MLAFKLLYNDIDLSSHINVILIFKNVVLYYFTTNLLFADFLL